MSVPFNSILTLIIISATNVLLIELFDVKKKSCAFLAGALFIASPLIGNSLSYGYMSPTFGLAYFLGVLAVYSTLKIRRTMFAVLPGAVLLAFSMGCYQAYFGVACILFLIWIVRLISQDAEWPIIGNTLVRAVCTLSAGGLLYKILLNIMLGFYEVELADYRGASSVSLSSIIQNLPQEIILAYQDFFRFFFTDQIQNTGWIKNIYLFF